MPEDHQRLRHSPKNNGLGLIRRCVRLVENYNKGLQVIVQQNDTQLTISFSRLMTLTLDPACFSFLFVCFLSFCFKVI